MALPPLNAYVGPGAASREKNITSRKEKNASPAKVDSCCPTAAAASHCLTPLESALIFFNKIECMETDSVGLFFGMIFCPQCFLKI